MSPRNATLVKPSEDSNDKLHPPNSMGRSYKHAWYLTVWALIVYAVCQLNVSVGSISDITNYMYSNNDSNGPKKIFQISILGERNSGTRWTWR
jgi:hypothetical protein